jgi:hypothetical protein
MKTERFGVEFVQVSLAQKADAAPRDGIVTPSTHGWRDI